MARHHKRTESPVAVVTAPETNGSEPLAEKDTSALPQALVWITLALMGAFSLLTFYYPAVRAFYHYQVNYNEGWNLCVTRLAMEGHRALYPAESGSTGAGYPFLSFYIVGYVSRLLGDALLAGRLLSLLSLVLSCLLVSLIVKELVGAWGPAVFAGVFCLGLFCTLASIYVGIDDPQLLAHPFFLLGLWLYMARPPSNPRLAGIASLFVVGGNIKHNLIPAPLAVLADLFTTSRSKAVRFIILGGILLVLAIAANILIGGPTFVARLLTARPYSGVSARGAFASVYSGMGLPLAISAFWSISQFPNRRSRVISIYFFISLLVGIVFAGGIGVNINTFFDNMFAMSIITGACLDSLWKAPIPLLGRGGRLRFLVPLLLYLTVLVDFTPRLHTLPDLVRELPTRQRLFFQEVGYLVKQPGPAICENLMLCYDAGKPYTVNPFGLGVRAMLHKGHTPERLEPDQRETVRSHRDRRAPSRSGPAGASRAKYWTPSITIMSKRSKLPTHTSTSRAKVQ